MVFFSDSGQTQYLNRRFPGLVMSADAGWLSGRQDQQAHLIVCDERRCQVLQRLARHHGGQRTGCSEGTARKQGERPFMSDPSY